MARLPITVKGVRRLVDGVVDNTMQAIRKFNDNVPTDEYRAEFGGPLEVQGTYAVDNNGELGFFANVVSETPVEGSVGLEDAGIDWSREGAGTMRMTFVCKVEIWPRDSEE